MDSNILVTIANLIILGATVFVSWKSARSKIVVDDSQASVNFQNIVIQLQAQAKEDRKEIKSLKEMMENANLEISLSIQVGEKPEVTYWKWATKVDSESKTKPIK